jgi:hypothetical protein
MTGAARPAPSSPAATVAGAVVAGPASLVRPARGRRGALLDPGWFFLLAGLMLVAATVLLPATEDLAVAQWHRQRVQAVLDHRQERLARHHRYLEAVERGDPTLVRSLAATQLNLSPANEMLLGPADDITAKSASVFPSLEPPPLVLPERDAVDRSLLERWALDDSSRLWLIAGGALCILIGLLPMSRPSAA